MSKKFFHLAWRTQEHLADFKFNLTKLGIGIPLRPSLSHFSYQVDAHASGCT